MKASDAIKMLEQLDSDQEVTVILGDFPIKNNDYNPAPYQPQFVPSYVRNPNETTCKQPNGIRIH